MDVRAAESVARANMAAPCGGRNARRAWRGVLSDAISKSPGPVWSASVTCPVANVESLYALMNHKRKRPKHRRAGCLLCKPDKLNTNKTADRMKANRIWRRLEGLD
jgi:hypothetical protein